MPNTREKDMPKSMVDEYLDCTGKRRFFRLTLYAQGRFLEAVELLNGEPTGWRFVLPVEPGKLPPWGEMRDRVREHLSRRHVVRDSAGGLHVLHRTIRAQITSGDTSDDVELPSLLVDDLELEWEDLGRLLRSYEGWKLRIRICDPSEE